MDNLIEKKLKIFEEAVMSEAKEKRSAIDEKYAQKKAEAIQKKENEVLEEAYNNIQKQKATLSRVKNETIAKALADSKRELILEREKIIASVFAGLYQRIDAYRSSEEYKTYLLHLVQKGIEEIGEGEVVVFLDEKDKDLLEYIQLQTKVKVEVDSMAIVGGCRILNNTKHIIIDHSLAEKISEEKEKFLQESGLGANVMNIE